MTEFLLYVAIFFAPIESNLFSIPVGSFQLSPFRMLIIMLLISVVIHAKTYVLIPDGINKPTVIFFLCWLFYAIITLLWSDDTGGWVRCIFYLFVGVLGVILCVNIVNSQQRLKRVFIAMQLSTVLQAAIGWYEVITRNYLFREMTGKSYTIYVIGEQRIPIAMQHNPNNFATLMFAGVFVSLICFSLSQKKVFKVLHIIALVNYTALLMTSTSRANIIGLLVAVAFILFVYQKRRMIIGIAAAIAVLLIPQTSQFLTNLFNFNFTGSGADSIRLGLMRNGFLFLVQTFGFGVGNGQVESWMETKSIYYHSDITNMHNWWMELLTAYGVLFFTCYMVYYCRLFLFNYRQIQNSRDSRYKMISLCICSMMIGFIVAAISASSNFSCDWLWMFWAVCIAYRGIAGKETVLYEE